MNKTFKKEERLCSRILLERLFHKGSSFVVYPFRIVYLRIDEPLPYAAQVVISVSKRKFKRANKRNTIKRKMREVYRIHKSEKLYPSIQSHSLNLLFAIQYIANEDLPYTQYEVKMCKAINQLIDEVVK